MVRSAFVLHTKEGWELGGTNTFGAIRHVYGFKKKKKIQGYTGKNKPIADTIFLLSDGSPSNGVLVSRAEILSEVERYHAKAQVVIHTIAYDITGIGRQIMADIARVTGGKFVEIGEKR